MWTILGSAAIAAGMFLVVRWRAPWIIAGSLVLVAAGVIITHQRPEESPPLVPRPLGHEDAEFLCGLVGSELLSVKTKILLSDKFGHEPMTDHLRGRWYEIATFASRSLGVCTPQWQNCLRILQRAVDTSGRDFRRASEYVGQAILSRKGCEEDLPADPDRNFPR